MNVWKRPNPDLLRGLVLTAFALSALALAWSPRIAVAAELNADEVARVAQAIGSGTGQQVLAYVCIFFAICLVYLVYVGHKERDKREGELRDLIKAVIAEMALCRERSTGARIDRPHDYHGGPG